MSYFPDFKFDPCTGEYWYAGEWYGNLYDVQIAYEEDMADLEESREG